MDIITYALCKAGDKKIMDIVNSLERITMTVVDEVPTVETAEPNKLYLVDQDGDGRYEEYIYAEIDGVPTIIELGPIVDFSAYYTSAQVDALLLPITTELDDLSFVKNIEKTATGSYVITFRDDTTLPIAVDTTVTEDSTNLVTSGAVAASIENLHIELTQAEYDALTSEEKNNGAEYFITDSTDSGDFSYLENRLSVLDGKSNTLNEIATLEVTDVKGVVHSSASPKYTFIKNKGENDCYISATDDVGEGADGTILLQSNSTIMLENLSDVNYICNSGKTTVICVCFQNSVNDPFARDESIGSSGGDSSTLGMEEIVLWENEGTTTNPETITLGEAITNFDEIILYNGTGFYGISSNIYVQSVLRQSNAIGIIEDTERRIWYRITSPTTLNKGDEDDGQRVILHSIVGRRYTRVSPTGYRQTTLWENSGTTNPDTITLSEAWSNFDELAMMTVGAGSVAAQHETAKHTSVMAIGGAYTMWYNSETTWGTYYATSSTVFTKVSSGGNYHISKIIGIKY